MLVFGCLGFLLLCRVIEAPIFGARRPATPWITVFVCRNALRILGIRRIEAGPRNTGAEAWVANHSSWLDIFALNASGPIYFVSKAEVAGWPGIGWLARATGTIFIERRRGDAARHKATFEDRIAAGHRLVFFPEGTSTDGLRVLPFKSTLFSAFFSFGLEFAVQPVTLRYLSPTGKRPDFYGWWGDMAFGPHLLMLLAAPTGGRVELVRGEPITVGEAGDRKTMALTLEDRVRRALAAHGGEQLGQGGDRLVG